MIKVNKKSLLGVLLLLSITTTSSQANFWQNKIMETKYGINLSNNSNGSIPRELFYNKVIKFYEKMKDVKYVFGGANMKGIDCSAFIRKFYEDEFGIKLTRSTHTQVYEGISIDKNELQLGDLIFFKEKKRVSNHVGIYLGKGKMLHSSSGMKGVAINNVSDYDNIYWTSRRVLDISL